MFVPASYYPSCKAIKDATGTSTSGLYVISPLGIPFAAYCDMSAMIDGGGWTLVVWINGAQKGHYGGGTTGDTQQVDDPALRNNGAKYSDLIITALNPGGKWYFTCGTKQSYVTNLNKQWRGTLTNTETWSIDNDRDGTFECAANRETYLFSDHPACTAGHANFGTLGYNGCYHDGEGWAKSGAVWAR